jgi:replicative superfamily II helicase
MQRLADHYNIPQEIVDIWKREEGENLLPLQVKAIEEFHLLEGRSLLITAPSSSGKTFVAEVAAINSYYHHKKTILLVPMKAIAEEKFADFVKKYERFGLRVVVSTHDRPEFDESILAGHFDIAIVIFEKMNALLTQSVATLNSCGLVVVDELQLLNDKSRGPGLEILLTKIKMIKQSNPAVFQFLGLSGVLADLNRFDRWLSAAHCMTQTRPLELHEGVLSVDGTVKTRNFNDGREYTQTVPRFSGISVPSGSPTNRREGEVLEESVLQRLVVICKYYLEGGKRILVFRKWRPLTRDTARRLAQELSLPAATRLIRELGEGESTNSREALIECLGGGVAFHNSDLSAEERLAVESHFRSATGQVQVVCSTTTLAMGVNLPASVVVMPDIVKPDPDAEQFHEIPITASEYKNMAGRAGRTRFNEEGTSILMVNSPAEATRCWRNYVKGQLDTLKPPLADDDLRKVMLSLFATRLCRNEQEIQNLLLSSYTGFVHWSNSPASRAAFVEVVAGNCAYLEEHGLLTRRPGNNFSTTPIGKLCAESGVGVESFVRLVDAIKQIDPTQCDSWDIIFPCLHCCELDVLLRIYVRVVDAQQAWTALGELDPPHLETLCSWSQELLGDYGDFIRRVQAFRIMNDWINCVDTRKIEDNFTSGTYNRILSGTIRNIAEITSWMVQTLGRIASVMDYDDGFVDSLRTLSERVARGVPADGIELHRLGVRGVTRPVIRRLVDAGYTSLDRMLDTPAADFRGIISPIVAQRIHEAIIEQLEELQGRAKHVQSSRLEKRGQDPRILREIYELEGIPLEEAFVNLLNAPSLALGAERITRQREGEPDIRIPLPQGLVVASVTASASNISAKKCAEILGSGARMNPTAYVVFGRPGFHELAVANAIPLNNQLGPSKSYKLIPVHELGELYVRVAEGTLSKEKFMDILLNHRGLVQSRLIK